MARLGNVSLRRWCRSRVHSLRTRRRDAGKAQSPGARKAELWQCMEPLEPRVLLNSAPLSPILNPENGHYYALVDHFTDTGNVITWPDANAATELLSFNGLPGHLATIESASENQFICS